MEVQEIIIYLMGWVVIMNTINGLTLDFSSGITNSHQIFNCFTK